MTTRRALLTGLAAVPLASVPTLAASHADNVPTPRLVRLKRRFDELWSEQDRLNAEWDRAHDLYHQTKPERSAALLRRAGIPGAMHGEQFDW